MKRNEAEDGIIKEDVDMESDNDQQQKYDFNSARPEL